MPALARALARDTGRAEVVGLTGPLGVGKSTTTAALVAELREQGRRVQGARQAASRFVQEA